MLGSYVWSKNLDELNGEGGLDTFETQIPTNDQRNIRNSSYGLAGDDRDQRASVGFRLVIAEVRVDTNNTAPDIDGLAVLRHRRDSVGRRIDYI